MSTHPPARLRACLGLYKYKRFGGSDHFPIMVGQIFLYN